MLTLCLLSPSALAHGNLNWASNYFNALGNIQCCVGPEAERVGDCREIPEDMGMPLKVGDTVWVDFAGENKLISVNIIHPSPDPVAPYVVCLPGCLFKPALG